MECPICFEPISIRKNYSFRCLHSVCKPCFRNMSKRGQTTVYEIAFNSTLIEFETTRLQCPLCRVDVLDKTQIAYLNALNECFPGNIK